MSAEWHSGYEASNLGKWDVWYQDLNDDRNVLGLYGDSITYLMASAFLSDLPQVEDWGCGAGGFRRFCVSDHYIGVDGSRTPFADHIADLREYRSSTPGILLRHVLEHDLQWSAILENAVASFQRKLCVVLFTPFSKETRIIADNRPLGVDVPDISFARDDIEKHFTGLSWRIIADIPSRTQYGAEQFYCVWREPW